MNKQQLNKRVTFWVIGVYLGAIVIFAVGFALWLGLGDDCPRSFQQQSRDSFSFDQEDKEYAEVLHVFDGDTFSVRINGKTETVRAIGIDAPETGEKYTDKECFANQAKQRATQLLEGKKVKLEADQTQQDRDQYDRLLRYVWLEDGRLFNQIMVEEGFATEYTYNEVEYLQTKNFKEAEQEAKKNNLGLWGECY